MTREHFFLISGGITHKLRKGLWHLLRALGCEKIKDKKRFTSDKLDHHRRHVLHQQEENTKAFPTSRQKIIFLISRGTVHTLSKKRWHLSRALGCVIWTCYFLKFKLLNIILGQFKNNKYTVQKDFKQYQYI